MFVWWCSVCLIHLITKKKKKIWSHFDLKSWVTGGTKIRPGIPSTWRIFESNWLYIDFDSILRINSNWLSLSSQFDSILTLTRFWKSIQIDSISSQFDLNILQLLGIPGRILVPPVTQLFRSKWLYFFFPLPALLKGRENWYPLDYQLNPQGRYLAIMARVVRCNYLLFESVDCCWLGIRMTFHALISARKKKNILKSEYDSNFKIFFFFLTEIWITWAWNVIRIPSQQQSTDSNKR